MSKNQTILYRIIPAIKDPFLFNQVAFFSSKIPIFLLVFPSENTKTTIMDTKYTFMSAVEASVTQKTEENPDPVQSAGKHMLPIY